ncbi:MAG TPA: hypothetical protein VIE15_03575 [Acidimicrobiales bacterium]
MTGFVQLMRFTTSKIEEVEAFVDRMVKERGDALLATRSTITKDRDHENTYWVIVEFASYEDAMKNSNDPETDRFAKELVGMLDGPPDFYNLDVRGVMMPGKGYS